MMMLKKHFLAMKYQNVISMVDSLANGINELISDDAPPLLPGKGEEKTNDDK